MLENFGVFRREDQMEEQVGIIDGLRERYESVVVEDKGDVFNNDLTQALELGFCLELAGVHDPRRARAQGEPRRARPARTTTPSATTSNFLKHSLIRWVDGAAAARAGRP